MNEATVKITGVKREELIGSDFFDTLHNQIWHEKSMRKFFQMAL
jgi:PAS domain-containing protein